MNDLLNQFAQVRKMGPLKSVISKLPGMDKQLKDVDVDDRQMDRMEAIILSMTEKERQNRTSSILPANAELLPAAV